MSDHGGNPSRKFVSAKKIRDNFESDRTGVIRYYKRASKTSKSLYKEADLWTIDNYRFAKGLLEEVQDSLSPKYLSKLPTKKDGTIRIFSVVDDYLEKNSHRFQETKLKNHLDQHQKKNPFTIGEIWAVPLILKVILINCLAQILSSYPNPKENRTATEKEGQMVKNIVLSFLSINKTDWRNFFESTSLVEKILRKDPAKVYAKMDFKTRDSYRHAIEQMAIQSHGNEIDIAEKILSLAQKEGRKKNSGVARKHVGAFLVGYKRETSEKEINYVSSIPEKLKSLVRHTKNAFYFSPLFLLAALVIFGSLLFLTKIAPFGPLSLLYFSVLFIFPSLIIAEEILNFILVRLFKPIPLYKMNYEEGVPNESRTMVVVSTLIGEGRDETALLAEMLEKNYLSNRDENIYFGLLLSFCETEEKNGTLTGPEKENFENLKAKIHELNKKYGRNEKKFFLFLRSRLWNEKEGKALEWERKRGKIIEFNRLLRGDLGTTYEYVDCPDRILNSIKYVITLDHNELLPKGSAQKLIATISHPLNSPQFDQEKNIVAHGFGIIQPRVSGTADPRPSALEQALFAASGWDPYASVVSDVYQDYYGYSLYVGKGIYDVDILNKVLNGRFPENCVLSHDHLEGFYCRVGNASDIQIFEDQPSSYFSYVKRLTRWIRGDWQNLRWLRSKVRDEKGQEVVNPLSIQKRWKLFENAARSLFLPSIFLIIISGLVLKPQLGSGLLILALIYLFFQPLLGFWEFLRHTNLNIAWRETVRIVFEQLVKLILGLGFSVIFLGHLALVILASILKTVYRMAVSKKRLLQWETFHSANKSTSGNFFTREAREFYPFEIIWLSLAFFLAKTGHLNTVSLLILGSWIACPIFAYFYSLKEKEGIEISRLSDADKEKLRQTALKTWRFFVEMVTPKTNFLPPDHFQEHAGRPVAQMTSITNIGMYLLSIQSASDLGFIGMDQHLLRTVAVFDSLSKMQRHRGHFFNWYNVQNLKPMLPYYISTVDSGNFAATLLVTKQALIELPKNDILGREFFESISTQISLLSKEFQRAQKKPAYRTVISDIRSQLYELQLTTKNKNTCDAKSYLAFIREIRKSLEKITKDGALDRIITRGQSGKSYFFTTLVESLAEKEAEIKAVYPWLDQDFHYYHQKLFNTLNQNTNLDDLKNAIEKTFATGTVITTDQQKALKSSLAQIKAYTQLAQKLVLETEKFLSQIDFGFLYSPERKLFKIGYNLTKKRFDRNNYDLLASESRITSYVAIAEDKIPLEHWSLLSRPLAAVKGRVALFSWGGSMFEYFFSQLFLPNINGSLLDIAMKTAFNEQVGYSRKKNIPWGISESSYFQKNKSGDFQYSLHGVPYLGLKQAPLEDLVVSPYSTFLALELSPKKVLANIARLEKEGASGLYGFYESVDYNSKVEFGSSAKILKIFLSHHQSSILVSIANCLTTNSSRKRFSENPQTESLGFLLNEKFSLPAKIHSAESLLREAKTHQIAEAAPEPVEEKYYSAPIMSLISNGNYKIFISNRGSGYSEYDNFRLTHFIPDPTLDHFGNFVYLKDEKDGQVWSPTYLPVKIKPKYYDVEIGENEAYFERTDNGILTKFQVGMVTDENLEYRSLVLKNNSPKTRHISVFYYGEAILAHKSEDRVHPAFSRLKNEVTKIDENTFLYSRLTYGSEDTIFLGQKGLSSKNPVAPTAFITSRKVFVGRLGTLKSPAILDAETEVVDKAHVFDHIFGVSQTFKLRPFEEVTVNFLSCASKNPEKVTKLLKKYRKPVDVEKSIRENLEREKSELTIDYEVFQKMLTCLLYRRRMSLGTNTGHHENGEGPKEKITEKLSIFNDFPVLSTKITGLTSKTTFKQIARYAYALAKKGFEFNFVIMAFEGDGYYQKTTDLVEKTFEEIGGRKEGEKIFKNLYLIKETELDEKDIQNLKNYSNLYLDPQKGSFVGQIETEFKKI